MKFPLTFPENHMPNKQLNEKKKKIPNYLLQNILMPNNSRGRCLHFKKTQFG